jgi:hypothetical protein
MGDSRVGQSTSESLCETCSHRKEIISGTGTRFLLCRLSHKDERSLKPFTHDTTLITKNAASADRRVLRSVATWHGVHNLRE